MVLIRYFLSENSFSRPFLNKFRGDSAHH